MIFKKERVAKLIYFVKREFNLIAYSPFGYLEIIFNPPNRKTRLEKYNPAVTRLGKRISRRLKKHFPELKVYYHGSSALRIAGKNDIDLLLLCERENFNIYLPKLMKLFGKYRKTGRWSLNWDFIYEGFRVELILIDPRSRPFREIVGVFSALQSNEELLREYERLKLKSREFSIRESEREKLYFYNKILALENN